MDKIRRRFLRAGNQQLHGGKCKVSWARVYRLLNRGGLGITDLEKFGRALQLRWLWYKWRCLEKLWCQTDLPVDNVDVALFATATRVHVRSGKMASFWTSSWLNGVSPTALFPTLYQHSRRKSRTIADAMNEGHWISDIMHNVTIPLIVDYMLLWELVEAAAFNSEDSGEDQIFWTRASSGEYTTKSAYLMQFDGGVRSRFPIDVWNVWAPSRCRFFLWLMLQNHVWIADRLMQREWPNQYFCPFCIRNMEIVAHLFTECPVVRQLWLEISNWASLPCFHPQSWQPEEAVPD
jgi:hypothetical protein